MKITYDPEADAIYILLHHAEIKDSVDIEDGVLADLDSEGHIVGLEILDASHRLTKEELTSVSYENLIFAAEETF
jgi:uncharacterized protein YuzE